MFRELAEHGSFTAAAEALSYTQSAVSQQIAALEREAGAKLVERNARGIRLTDAGAHEVNLGPRRAQFEGPVIHVRHQAHCAPGEAAAA